MTCRPLAQLHSAFGEKPFSLNAPPQPQASGTEDSSSQSYLCDSFPELASLLQSTPVKRPPVARLFEPPASIQPSRVSPSDSQAVLKNNKLRLLLSPPQTPFAKVLYELLTQLEDFKLTAQLDLPIHDQEQNKDIDTSTRLELGEHGSVDQAGVHINTTWDRRIPLPGLRELSYLPLVGGAGFVRILSLEMNPQTRQLEGKVKWVGVPMTVNLQDKVAENESIPSEALQGEGYDLRQGLPQYAWQWAEAQEKILNSMKSREPQGGLDSIVPYLKKAQLSVKGDFSNEKIQIGDLTLTFFPKQSVGEHRLTLEGSLSKPTLKIWGLKSIAMHTDKGEMVLEDLEKKPHPVSIEISRDVKDISRSIFTIKKYNTSQFRIDGYTYGKDAKHLRFNLEEGLEVQDLVFRLQPEGPQLYIKKITSRKTSFEGLGLHFKNNSEEDSSLSHIRMGVSHGKPHFYSVIEANANGSIAYKAKELQGAAWMEFNELSAKGNLRLGVDKAGHAFFKLAGNISTNISTFKLLFELEEDRGGAYVGVEDAHVKGEGSLTVWPGKRELQLKAFRNEHAIEVSGNGGHVLIDQKALPEDSELKNRLNLDVSKIAFKVDHMTLNQAQQDGEEPMLQVSEAKMSDLEIQGDLDGKGYLFLDKDVPLPFVVDPKKGKMEGVTVKIGDLHYWTTEEGIHSNFKDILLFGEQSQATLSPKDQERCGFDHQKIQVDLNEIRMGPNHDFYVQEGEDPSSLQLKLPEWIGGCLSL